MPPLDLPHPATPDAAEPDLVELGGALLRAGDAIGPYRFERMVGHGGMAEVLLVREDGGPRLALKVLKAHRVASGLVRFRREFRALARLRHPNIVSVHAYGDYQGHPYISMEYTDGPDLYQTLRRFKDMAPDARWRRTEEILIDLCQGLAYIHRRGLVHRDLKPSNVLQTTTGRCKLTDFGIVKDLGEIVDPSARRTRVGTWAYTSPEQISGDPVDHRSDLYSLGVILYTMLAGRRPFTADDMAGYLEAHQHREPIPPSRYDASVPPRLEEICLRLLQKAPADRYQSALEILYVLEQLDLDSAARRAQLSGELPLVGRAGELAVVGEAFAALQHGTGSVVLLEGAEGVGKSRLLAAAVDQARAGGFPVQFYRLGPQDGSYKVLLQLATDVSRELGDRLPTELRMAVRGFFAARGEPVGDARYQLFDGLREGVELLLETGPRVFVIDDLHLAPPPLSALLAYVVRAVVARSRKPLLVLAATRPVADLRARADGEDPSAAVRAVTAFVEGANLGLVPVSVPVLPLVRDEVGHLVQTLLGAGAASEALAGRLHAATGGNALFLTEFLRSLRQRGLLTESGGRLSLATDASEIATGHLEIPPGVRQVVQRRLEALDEGDRGALEVLSVSERELDQDILLDALLTTGDGDAAEEHDTADEEAALDRIDRLVDAGLLVERRGNSGVRYDLVHRSVGDVLYRQLPAERRAALHRRLAMLMASRAADSPVSAEAIGEHFRRAGEPGLAYQAYVHAAAHLWARSLTGEAWDVALRAAAQEEQAEGELDEDEFHASRRALLQVRADALFNRGQWDEAKAARELLIEEADRIEDDRLLAVARLGLGVLLRRLGRHAEGEQVMREVLSDARARTDRASVLDALRNLSAIAWDKGDLDETERLASEGLVSATGPEHAAGRAHLLLALTAVQATRGQLAAATTGLLEAEGILRRLRIKRTLCLAVCNLAELLVWQGELSRAVARATDALSLAEEVVFRVGEAFATRVRATALLEVGDLEGAARDADRALQICEELELAEDRAVTRAICGRLALARGQTKRAVDHLAAGVAATRDWDPEYFGPVLQTLLAQVQSNNAPELLDAARAALPSLQPVRRVQVQLGLATALASSAPDEARALAREVAGVAAGRGLRLWALDARLLLCALASESERLRARDDAAEIAWEILRDLPPDLAASFRARPAIAALGV